MGQLSSTARVQIQSGSQCAEAQLVPIDIHQFRRRRESLKLTQTDVATACDCSISFISKWENGQRKPLADLHRRLGAFQRRMDEEPDPIKATLKHCWKCDRTLEVAHFAIDRQRSSGQQTKCRECSDDLSSRWRERNRERVTLARKQKSDTKQARRRTKSCGERPSRRDHKELRELGDEGSFKLRKRPNRGFSNERKNAIEKEAGTFLAKHQDGVV